VTEPRERRPRTPLWRELPSPSVVFLSGNTLAASAWERGSVSVVSALEVAELPQSGGLAGPTWHISISRRGKRPKPRDVEHALDDFDMRGADQDNHHPGAARHFFMPVDERYRSACECKTDEAVIVEADGYEWTTPRELADGACRGCEFQRMRGKPCPIHTPILRAP
jgi:hypothetical protein